MPPGVIEIKTDTGWLSSAVRLAFISTARSPARPLASPAASRQRCRTHFIRNLLTRGAQGGSTFAGSEHGRSRSR